VLSFVMALLSAANRSNWFRNASTVSCCT
jgi:hypothetical protein